MTGVMSDCTHLHSDTFSPQTLLISQKHVNSTFTYQQSSVHHSPLTPFFRWTVGGKEGRVAAAAWAPDGFQLLFATTDEAVLYSVSFQVGGGR